MTAFIRREEEFSSKLSLSSLFIAFLFPFWLLSRLQTTIHQLLSSRDSHIGLNLRYFIRWDNDNWLSISAQYDVLCLQPGSSWLESNEARQIQLCLLRLRLIQRQLLLCLGWLLGFFDHFGIDSLFNDEPDLKLIHQFLCIWLALTWFLLQCCPTWIDDEQR